MFDFLIGLIEEEVRKYKENPGAYELETKKYNKLDPMLICQPGDQVNYHLAYAIKSIAKNPNISPENQIILKGTNPISSKYLWTALMIIGSILPTKFDHRSIKNWVSGFDPSSEMGYVWGFSAN